MNKGIEIIYLSTQDIIEFNVLALSLIKTKKADKSEVLSYQKLQDIVNGCEETDGDIYDKAVFLLTSTTKKHVFASGNRRKHLLLQNIFYS